MVYPTVLELPDTKLTLRQVERGADGALFLHLRGFAFHSSLAVDGVSITRREGHPLVVIALVPVRKGKDGNFDLRVELASEQEIVMFGDQAQQVWPVQ